MKYVNVCQAGGYQPPAADPNWPKGGSEYNYGRGGHAMDETTVVPQLVADNAVMAGTDVLRYTRERPGMSALRLRTA